MFTSRDSISVIAALFPETAGLSVAAEGDVETCMCLDRKKSADVCGCASKTLQGEVDAENIVLAECGEANHLGLKSKGVGMSKAWKAVVRAAAGGRRAGLVATLNKTYKIGESHRAAMKACAF